jgi:transposase
LRSCGGDDTACLVLRQRGSKRVRDLERLLGRKTMENEILKEAIVVARLKKPTLPQVSWSDREDGSR